MSRCYRCNGCRDQWLEAEGKYCPHCNFPGIDTRSIIERGKDCAIALNEMLKEKLGL